MVPSHSLSGAREQLNQRQSQTVNAGIDVRHELIQGREDSIECSLLVILDALDEIKVAAIHSRIKVTLETRFLLVATSLPFKERCEDLGNACQ
jgi:hypothetical protein